MAAFNLKDYELVQDRQKRFLKDHPDGRMITEYLTTTADRAQGVWVTRTLIYLNAEDQAAGRPKGSGLAFERDSDRGPQATSALEVCETSSQGRALASIGYFGDKKASREEMEKVQRNVQAEQDWGKRVAMLTSKADARALYAEAARHASQDVLALITEAAAMLPD